MNPNYVKEGIFEIDENACICLSTISTILKKEIITENITKYCIRFYNKYNTGYLQSEFDIKKEQEEIYKRAVKALKEYYKIQIRKIT